jgi:hypothetical protein
MKMMEDSGSFIFFIIQALLALVGSLQGRKKKPPVGKSMPPGKMASPKPGQKAASILLPPQTVSKPQHATTKTYLEGRFDKPKAGASDPEGSTGEPMAAAFASEGSVRQGMAEAFAMEGSIQDGMAAAFATEGVSGLSDIQIKSPGINAFNDSEIHDLPEYMYNIEDADDFLTEGFDLRKAVIYSAVLNRKEYSF